MNIKHRHHFETYCHVIGARHGSYRRCDCGAQTFAGSLHDTFVRSYISRRGRTVDTLPKP